MLDWFVFFLSCSSDLICGPSAPAYQTRAEGIQYPKDWTYCGFWWDCHWAFQRSGISFLYCNCHLNFVIFGDHFLTLLFFFFHFFKNGISLERWADFSVARLFSGGDCQIMYWNRCHKIWPSYHAWSLLSISIIAHHQWLLEGNQILRNYHQPYNLTIICENPARHVRICILTEISKTYLGILDDHFDDYCLVLYCLEKSICFSKCLCIDFLSFSMMIY